MLSYIANINTAQIIQAICKRKNILILNSQEGETDIKQYIKETKVNFNLIKYLVIDISALINSDTEIIESIYNFSKLYTRARIVIIATGYDCQNAILTNLYDLGFYNIINDLELEEKLKKEQYLKYYRRKEKTTGIDGNFLIAYNKKVGFKHRMFISYIRCSFCKY